MIKNLPLWQEITREERYFTSFLFHDIRSDHKPFVELLKKITGLENITSLSDVGYEVCYFRDTAKILDEPAPSRDKAKQTFDLMLWLPNKSVIVIEAKAYEGFNNDQLENLQSSIDAISSEGGSITTLLGICSSRYSPRESTKKTFKGIIRWSDIAEAYPDNKAIYKRADDVYPAKDKKI